MLTHLTISGFAIVDHLDLDFSSGMSVITGETGAGKSIMLDALSLTLGDRAESGQIGSGRDKAEITTEFDLSGNREALDWLDERDLKGSDDHCILRRILAADGRSRAYINGSPVTLQDLKALGSLLIDVHSQHEHQSLLKRDIQRRLLDEYAGLEDLLHSINKLYEEYRELRDELRELLGENTDQSARLQLLNYQAEELDAAAIEADEHRQLEIEHKRLSSAEKSLERLSEAINLIEDGEPNAKDMLAQALHRLQSVDDESLRPIKDMLSAGLVQVEEAGSDLRTQADKWEMDPQRLAAVEDRLSQIYEIARKHHISPEQIPEVEAGIRAELEKLEHLDTYIQKIESRLSSLKEGYQLQGRQLHEKRKEAALALQKKVNHQLARLGMKGAEFSVGIDFEASEEPRANGLDQITYRISTNPGSQPGPLNRIASGGELSRISLAIQVVTAETSRVPSLIFDEVDVGVGGATAEVVGQLLRQLGENTQVICVTHLPQVAAQGHHHYRVSKLGLHSEGQETRAQTRIQRLEDREKVGEIARMLGGINMTDQSLAHAEEMFRLGQQSGS